MTLGDRIQQEMKEIPVKTACPSQVCYAVVGWAQPAGLISILGLPVFGVCSVHY